MSEQGKISLFPGRKTLMSDQLCPEWAEKDSATALSQQLSLKVMLARTHAVQFGTKINTRTVRPGGTMDQ